MRRSEFQKQHIFICNGKDCKKNGCEGLKAKLKETLKSTNNKSVRLIKTKCMDYCKLGPNVSIQGNMYHDCKIQDAASLLDKITPKP